MKFKQHIEKITRRQTSQNRDLLKGIMLDRNERVDFFEKKEFKKVVNNFALTSFNATPDISLLYKKIALSHNLNRDNIYITQGITECMAHIIFSILKENDEAIVMSPTYPMYEVLLKLNNIKYKLWKFDDNFKLNIKDLEKIISKKTKILFLVNPNLPIEYEFDENQKSQIYKICKKHNILIVYDEAYHYFGSKSEIININKKKNLIIMRTFSKAFGLSGLRLGYMVANKKLTNYISKCRSLVETNSLTYQVALWALKKKIFEENVKSVKEGSEFLRNQFKINNEYFHGGIVTNAILLKLPSKTLANKLVEWLRKKKIYIRGGFEGSIKNFVRISLGSKKKMSVFFKEYKKWKKKYIVRKLTH